MTADDLKALGAGAPKMSYSDQQNAIISLEDEVKYYQEELNYYKQVAAQDPWKNNPPQTADEKFADRMLDHRVPESECPAGETLWLTRSDVFELLALIPGLEKKDYRRFVRDFEDIETMSQGGGNRQIVRSRQERLAFELQLYRSVPETPERILLATKRQEIDQTMRTPATPRGGKGFVDSIMSRFH